MVPGGETAYRPSPPGRECTHAAALLGSSPSPLLPMETVKPALGRRRSSAQEAQPRPVTSRDPGRFMSRQSFGSISSHRGPFSGCCCPTTRDALVPWCVAAWTAPFSQWIGLLKTAHLGCSADESAGELDEMSQPNVQPDWRVSPNCKAHSAFAVPSLRRRGFSPAADDPAGAFFPFVAVCHHGSLLWRG